MSKLMFLIASLLAFATAFRKDFTSKYCDWACAKEIRYCPGSDFELCKQEALNDCSASPTCAALGVKKLGNTKAGDANHPSIIYHKFLDQKCVETSIKDDIHWDFFIFDPYTQTTNGLPDGCDPERVECDAGDDYETCKWKAYDDCSSTDPANNCVAVAVALTTPNYYKFNDAGCVGNNLKSNSDYDLYTKDYCYDVCASQALCYANRSPPACECKLGFVGNGQSCQECGAGHIVKNNACLACAPGSIPNDDLTQCLDVGALVGVVNQLQSDLERLKLLESGFSEHISKYKNCQPVRVDCPGTDFNACKESALTDCLKSPTCEAVAVKKLGNPREGDPTYPSIITQQFSDGQCFQTNVNDDVHWDLFILDLSSDKAKIRALEASNAQLQSDLTTSNGKITILELELQDMADSIAPRCLS